jgi:hypothetical protein
MPDRELKRGSTEMLILALVEDRPRHGYEIAKLIEQRSEKGSYLAVTVHGNPADPRTDDIVGDVVVNGQVLADWGLHLIDVNLAIGNLIDIVSQQAKAYLKSAGKK